MISIICSNLNSINWINGYLESINNQFYKKFDIHFIDAGSNDGSWEMIKKFSFRSGINPSYIIQKDCSIYEAWNIGCNKAETEYFMYVNTDDRLFPNALNIMSGYANNYNYIDVFYSPCLITNDMNHKSYNNLYDWPYFSINELLKRCICGPFPLVKLKSAIEVGLFSTEFPISGDYEMWLRMFSKGKKFLKINDPIGGYYLNPTGMSTNAKTLKKHLKEDDIIRKMYAHLYQENIEKEITEKSFLKKLLKYIS